MEGENKLRWYEEIHQENLKKQADKQEEMELIRKNAIIRLQTDPEIQQYFSRFTPSSVESFTTGYANHLMLTLQDGNMYASMHEKHSTEYMQYAQNCLEDIQVKKLFDLRCQWGANLVKCAGIELTTDFHHQVANVLNSKLLTPISREELDLYLKYAYSDDFVVPESNNIDWFVFEHLRDADDDAEAMSPWFIFQNSYTGNSGLTALPDLRGDMENHYCNLFFEERESEQAAKQKSGEAESFVQDTRPHISGHQYVDVIEFMKKFEKPETVRLFESSVEFGNLGIVKPTDDANTNDWLNEEVEKIMHKLNVLPKVKLAVEANADWRRALIAGWAKFAKEQTIAALPAAYENYLFMMENKIAFPTKEMYINFSEELKKQIIRGRELNGEPGDLDF